MTEQLISFETAKLAKKKGFNIHNDYFYCEEYGLCQLGEETLHIFNHPKTNESKVIYDVNSEFEEGERFSAPTQFLLQKWLREKHKLHPHAVPHKDHAADLNDPIVFRLVIYGRYAEGKEYKNYEECLEVALLSALKLIP